MDERIVAKGKIFELIQLPQSDGRVFEVARRAPGVRLIIADLQQKKVLLSKEFRHELKDWDYRLPGGKVFDTLDEFEIFRASGGDILEPATQKAREEAVEEVGIDVSQLELFAKSTLGATVDWDLYIFEAKEWRERKDGNDLKEDEINDIAGSEMFGFDKVKQMILNGSMQEERVALALLRWLDAKEE